MKSCSQMAVTSCRSRHAPRNCFKDKVGYISISAGGKCTKYSSWGGDTIAKLELECGLASTTC